MSEKGETLAIDRWTGALAVALQRAGRMTNEQFATYLGMSVRGVAIWHQRQDVEPVASTQQILDEALSRVSPEVRARFDQLVENDASRSVGAADQEAWPESHEGISADLAFVSTFRIGSIAGSVSTAEVLAAANEMRRGLEDFLYDGSSPRSRLDWIEEGVNQHACDALAVAPLEMVCRIGLDLAEVRYLGDRSRTEAERLKVKRLAARLAIIIMADEMSVLGHVQDARSWYSTAIAAADAVGDDGLRADVRTLAAMLPLYHGSPERVIALTDEASTLAAGKTGLASSLSAMLNGLAWAKIGNTHQAITSLDAARNAHDRMSSACLSESVFGFSTRRRLFYESRALTLLGHYEKANTAQCQALELYPSHVVGDRALIVIDQATALVSTGEFEAGAALAVKTLERLPPSHRTRLFEIAARNVVDAVPHQASKLAGVKASVEAVEELVGGPVG